MTIRAKADKITIFERQLRVLVQVLDVVDSRRLSLPAVPLAALALIVVTAKDSLALMLPQAGPVEIFNIHCCSLIYASARTAARASHSCKGLKAAVPSCELGHSYDCVVVPLCTSLGARGGAHMRCILLGQELLSFRCRGAEPVYNVPFLQCS